ncbi:hypothetical protein ACPW96_22765 [Micromonospora sp. DT81.3]|uniref:hypothetical protein n=1 Tax=Micromonospora sp. DT81.3 TaxID=3416523 RepID=UPI003CEB4DC8
MPGGAVRSSPLNEGLAMSFLSDAAHAKKAADLADASRRHADTTADTRLAEAIEELAKAVQKLARAHHNAD